MSSEVLAYAFIIRKTTLKHLRSNDTREPGFIPIGLDLYIVHLHV